jgi:hypothetical protein
VLLFRLSDGMMLLLLCDMLLLPCDRLLLPCDRLLLLCDRLPAVPYFGSSAEQLKELYTQLYTDSFR